MSKILKIAGACLNQIPIHWEHNTQNIIQAIAEAKALKADILCFPELSIPGYGCEDLFLSDWVSKESWRQLLIVREACENITVCVGLPIRFLGFTYNAVCVVRDKKILGVNLKQFLARDGVHYEPRWFEPWPSGRQTFIEMEGEQILAGDVNFELHGVSIGFEICEDAWRPNRPGINLHKRNIELIFNPSASHFAFAKNYEREKLVIDSSANFNCTYVYVNHLGNEAGRMIYDGDIIIAQKGKLIANNSRLNFKSFNILSLEVDFSEVENQKTVLMDERISKFEEFTRAATLALFDYLRKSGSSGYVLSLSGGADSACCAVLVAEMIKRATNTLGWNRFYELLKLNPKKCKEDIRLTTGELLTCAYQSTVNSSDKTYDAAKALANGMGAIFYHWNLNDNIQSYTAKIENALQRKLSWETDDIALQNIQARSRSPIIWMLANIKNALLITTSNRSEGDVGYATMDGDTSGSIAPLAGVDKSFILNWLKWAEQELGYSILSSVNKLKPSAELRPQEREQTDEEDLMPYHTLLEIEKLAIRDRLSPVQVFNTLKHSNPNTNLLKKHISKFFKLWSINQWKRERTAPSFHFDDMNIDPRSWCRFPILSGNFAKELAELQQSN